MSCSVPAVTPDDLTPPDEQLRRQLVDLLVSGQFMKGERLPPLRQLAGDLPSSPTRFKQGSGA